MTLRTRSPAPPALSQEKERLALNVDELNDIVFSKTFQPPSAWADRERKYKMEKRDWETEVSTVLSPSPSHCLRR